MTEVLGISVSIKLRCYIDVPVEEWVATCEQLGLEARGKTNREAREKLVEMIKVKKFKPCD